MEFIVYFITFISTLIFGISNGIFFSIFISLLIVIYRSSRPNIVTLGLTKQGVFRNIERFPNSITREGA